MTPQQNDPQAAVRQQVQETIGAAQIPDDAKAQAWDAFFGSNDAGSFRQSMNSVKDLPNDIKLKLTGLKFPEASGRVQQTKQPTQTQQATASKPPQLIPSAPPGSDHRPQGGPPLPADYLPDASSLWGALTTPLTQQFGMDLEGSVAKNNRAIEAATPEWFRPIQKFESGMQEAATGAAEQMSAPLSILLAPFYAMDEAGAQLPKAVQMGKKALGVIGGAASAADSAKHVYTYFKTGDTGELGKAAVEIPLSILGFQSGRSRRPAAKQTPQVSITGEAEPVTPPDYSQPRNRLGEGQPDPRRISNVGPEPPRQLEAPSAERTQIEQIANSSGPFKGQVYEWARQPLAEIAKQREQALKNYRTVQAQFSGETAPFSDQPGVTNTSQAVPKGSTSQIPTGKGEFTAGGPRVLLDRAKAQYEALDKLYQMKAKAAGIASDTPGADLPGRPMPSGAQPPQPVHIRGALPGPGGAHEPPPGAITISPIRPDYRPTGSPMTETPGGRLGLPEPEARVMSPQFSMEQNLQMAEYMPKEILEKNIEDMRVAAAQHAAEMVAQANKDPAKMADVKSFIEQAKARLDQFQALYDRLWKEGETPKGETPKGDTPPKPKNKPKPPKETAPKPPKEPASKQEPPKQEPAPPRSEGQGAGEGTITQHLSDQMETAKASGLKSLKLTIDRGPGKNPLVIGVNPEFDTPEELAKQISKAGGASGMATMSSNDPERPVTWKFLIGEAAPPPGAK